MYFFALYQVIEVIKCFVRYAKNEAIIYYFVRYASVNIIALVYNLCGQFFCNERTHIGMKWFKTEQKAKYSTYNYTITARKYTSKRKVEGDRGRERKREEERGRERKIEEDRRR